LVDGNERTPWAIASLFPADDGGRLRREPGDVVRTG
jgi:hypothetical protein